MIFEQNVAGTGAALPHLVPPNVRLVQIDVELADFRLHLRADALLQLSKRWPDIGIGFPAIVNYVGDEFGSVRRYFHPQSGL